SPPRHQEGPRPRHAVLVLGKEPERVPRMIRVPGAVPRDQRGLATDAGPRLGDGLERSSHAEFGDRLLVAEMRRRVHDAEAVGHADDDAARTEERLATPESQRKAHAGERDERVVRRAIEEGRRQPDDDDVSGWCGPHETPVGLGPGGGADAIGGSGEDVDDATAIGHRLHVEDGPRPGLYVEAMT